MDFEKALAGFALTVLLPLTALGILWMVIHGYA